MDELDKLQDRCDNSAASWEESRQLLLYVIRGLVERDKKHEDAIAAIKLKVAFVAGGCGLAGALIPIGIEMVSHLTYK